jgi:hypothetical protein
VNFSDLRHPADVNEMTEPDDHHSSFFAPLFRDGRPLLTLGTVGLTFAGGFAVFLGLTGQFLPHDVQFLGMTAADLCAHNACSIVHFMVHDRVSFGGILLALAVLYLWLIHFPLRGGEPWAFYTLLASVAVGFASFLAYLPTGYLDRWHAAATVALLPCFVVGLSLAYRALPPHAFDLRATFRAAGRILRGSLSSRVALGQTLFLSTAAALFVAGCVITLVGLTTIFVPQDLQYMRTTIESLDAINPRLVPLIAHDRAGFGANVLNVAILLFACPFFSIRRSGGVPRHLREALTVAGAVAFTAAIGIHPVVGYNNPVHLAPAILAAVAYATGLFLLREGRPRSETGPIGAASAPVPGTSLSSPALSSKE